MNSKWFNVEQNNNYGQWNMSADREPPQIRQVFTPEKNQRPKIIVENQMLEAGRATPDFRSITVKPLD